MPGMLKRGFIVQGGQNTTKRKLGGGGGGEGGGRRDCIACDRVPFRGSEGIPPQKKSEL